MKNILNAKVVAWVYVVMGVVILAIQLYRTTAGAPIDWFRLLPGVIFVVIGVFRLISQKPSN